MSEQLRAVEGPTLTQADMAIDGLERFIRQIYLPFRGAVGYKTERAILVADAHVPHRENDAEHSWHIEKTVQYMHANRSTFGLNLPDDFDIGRARNYATTHDLIEIVAGDTNAVTRDKRAKMTKPQREKAAALYIRKNLPDLAHMIDEWEDYEAKDTVEKQFVSDNDKINGTLMVYVDQGRRWHDWEGESASREEMCTEMKGKLFLPDSRAIFAALERKLDQYPEYFPHAIYTPTQLFDPTPYEPQNQAVIL